MNRIKIPEEFYNVEYASARVPGVENQSDLSLGANCQVFAYALLEENGLHVPNDRSSELWSDTSYSEAVTEFEALDLMLYNSTSDAYGAHVAVYIGEGRIIHLSLQNGRPEITTHICMLSIEKYKCFIGAKRVVKNRQ